jgi:Resolvase, N terminal domain
LGGIIAQEVCPLIPEDEAGPRRICQRVLVRAEPPTGPQLQAMLACLAEDPSIDCLVVHKLDRLAWNLEDRRGQGRASKGLRATALVTESLEDSASGKLVEGILASIAEFYSPISARRSARASTRRRRMVVSRPCPPWAIGTSDTTATGAAASRCWNPISTPRPSPRRSSGARWAHCLSPPSPTPWQRRPGQPPGKPSGHQRDPPHAQAPGHTLASSVGRAVECEGTHQPLVSRDLLDKVQSVLDTHSSGG